ncbi:hypothetical protein LZC95_27720 [Pendulispora brunnea]|uniref:Secreted protein n=1 Tax=Pendulispora brunnea TaxID=2905690 RepID=A0ABZ2JUV1_9BACT
MTTGRNIFALMVGLTCAATVGCAADQGEEGTENVASEGTASEAVVSEEAIGAAPEEVASEVSGVATEGLTTLGAAPSCIKKTFLSSNQIHLSSDCNFDTGVRVIISWGRDSNCIRIPAHRTGYTYSWWPGSFDRLDSC